MAKGAAQCGVEKEMMSCLVGTPKEDTPLLNRSLPSSLPRREDMSAQLGQAIGWRELRPLVSLALPLILSAALDHVSSVVPIMMMGHLSAATSKEYISAIAMGMTFLLLTAWTVVWGTGSAMDTLCSQSYGAGQATDLGLVFQAGWLAGNLLLLPTMVLGIFCKEILLVFGQTSAVSTLASHLVLLMLPILPVSLFYDLLRRVLQSQNIVTPLMAVSCVSVVANIGINYALMFHTSLGYVGRAVAVVIMALLAPLLLWPYLVGSPVYRQEWKGWDLHAAWILVPKVLHLGISGAAMQGFELWGISIASIVAGMLPNAEVAISADVCMHGFRGFFYMLYGPVAVAGSVRVGNALGANDPTRARLAAWQCVAMCASLGIVAAVCMVVFRHTFPFLYTQDKEVVLLTARLLLVCAPFQTTVAIYVGIMGIFRGSGQQTRGAILNGVANLLVGLPLGITLADAFENGIVGLWLGISVAFLLCALYGFFWLVQVDWNALARDAHVRTRDTHLAAEELDGV
ncbi:hypothetical protein H310_05349 [Aphanomyces invadans]|uniref:MATE efflux family protein n=1 Tax=Aphanomyces invadans TaxID=157072 RepID=A0A024UAH8_9STRA|nr:hypothetical protein H310_05349 [Aphanomyces invadans]ETW02877.1 hypothetical protein H310_05349 [Aphanomyces invadans]|eukprot:XP_008868261.1 hypothetical protein H310_05349 [Aphanomyces invadans]